MVKNTAVYIGRFSPPHIGHNDTIKYMVEHYDKVIVAIGSSNKRRSPKNPFEVSTIANLIQENNPSINIIFIDDYQYDENKWIAQVQEKVNTIAIGNITLVGHDRDASSYYLKEFPNWDFKEIGVLDNDISGTAVRNEYFHTNLSNPAINIDEYDKVMDFIISETPKNVGKFLKKWATSTEYKDIYEEIQYHKKEADKYQYYPYPETLKLNCADIVLSCSGYILLVKRKVAPGKGSWALPGGFVNRTETFKNCAIRKLFEETSIKVPRKIIEMSILDSKMFDSPKRNEGIPRVSYSFYSDIKPDIRNNFTKLPKIKSNDTTEAKWISISEIKSMKLFDDHSDIINYFTKSL